MSCRHNVVDLSEEDRYYINSERHNNCVFCLIDERGSMTQEDISQYFGVSKMRISQIEKQALEKVRKKAPHLFQ